MYNHIKIFDIVLFKKDTDSEFTIFICFEKRYWLITTKTNIISRILFSIDTKKVCAPKTRIETSKEKESVCNENSYWLENKTYDLVL